MDWVTELSSLEIPIWIQNVGTAAIGALLAYTVWSWLHSPHLYPARVIHQDVVEVDRGDTQRSIRLEVHNIGTKAAENCEAVLRLRVPIGDDVIRSYFELPWLPQRADLIVDDRDQEKRNTIPAGRSCKLELFRQFRDGNTQMYPGIGGSKYILTSSGDQYHRPASSEAEFAVLDPSSPRKSDVVRTSGELQRSEVLAGEWSDAVMEVVVETESARPLEISFDVSVRVS